MTSGQINRIQEFPDHTGVKTVYTDGSPVRAMTIGVTGKCSFQERNLIAKKSANPINAKIPGFIAKLPNSVYRPNIR
jgi:hypothetical protein